MRACVDAGAASVLGVEIDTKIAARATRRFARNCTASVVTGDFLEMQPRGHVRGGFDVATANTPYENGADAAHLEQMLRHAPRAVAIMRLNAIAGTGRYERLWSRFEGR